MGVLRHQQELRFTTTPATPIASQLFFSSFRTASSLHLARADRASSPRHLHNGSTSAALITRPHARRFSSSASTDMSTAKSLHELTAEDNQGHTVGFSQLKGKVVLIVNVASKCGFTPQYKELQALYEKYKDQGLEIVGFPCNQFGSQEPGSDAEIQEFCQKNYGVSFPIMKKIHVNGDDVHPVYAFLKNSKSGLLGLTRIKWNFEKFLVDKEGVVEERYSSLTKPESLEPTIEKLLHK